MLRIGICDDDREYREKIHDLVIHSIFSYDDAQVVHYMSGKQVVDDIEKEEFDIDLLLLDINMPEYDGLNTATNSHFSGFVTGKIYTGKQC